jgi:hypothetical protein
VVDPKRKRTQRLSNSVEDIFQFIRSVVRGPTPRILLERPKASRAKLRIIPHAVMPGWPTSATSASPTLVTLPSSTSPPLLTDLMWMYLLSVCYGADVHNCTCLLM